MNVLSKIGEGTTTRAYIYDNKVYKYLFHTSPHTDFDTKPSVLKKLVELHLVLPEQEYKKNIIITDYCPSVFDVKKYETDTIYNIKLQLLIIHFADALATKEFYGLDLHLGNVGRHSDTGKYYIIDHEGFIHSKNGKLQAKRIVVINGQKVPTIEHHKTWLSIFDPVEGWFATPEMGEIVNTYVNHMKKVKTEEDKRLRTFISHYLMGDENPSRRHLLGGLKFLQITSVYANATPDTRNAVDTFLVYYKGNGYLQLATKESLQHFTFSKPFLNQPHYEEQLTQLATYINDEYPAPVLTSSFTISPILESICIFNQFHRTCWCRILWNTMSCT